MSIQLLPGLQNEPLDRVLEDLLVRFVVNATPEELSSNARVFFLFEEAHWYYLDYARALNPELPLFRMKSFCKKLIEVCPIIWKGGDPSEGLKEFVSYKQSIPVRGAALFNSSMTKLLLVQGVESTSWSFPRGKISKDEEDHDCAIREVKEEVGMDITPYLNKEEYIERTLKGKNYRIYICRNVPEDFEFKPIVKNEIKSISWMDFKKIKDKVKQDNSNKFFLVNSMYQALQQWVNKNKGEYNETQLKLEVESQLKSMLGIKTIEEVEQKPTVDPGRDLLDFIRKSSATKQLNNIKQQIHDSKQQPTSAQQQQPQVQLLQQQQRFPFPIPFVPPQQGQFLPFAPIPIFMPPGAAPVPIYPQFPPPNISPQQQSRVPLPQQLTAPISQPINISAIDPNLTSPGQHPVHHHQNKFLEDHEPHAPSANQLSRPSISLTSKNNTEENSRELLSILNKSTSASSSGDGTNNQGRGKNAKELLALFNKDIIKPTQKTEEGASDYSSYLLNLLQSSSKAKPATNSNDVSKAAIKVSSSSASKDLLSLITKPGSGNNDQSSPVITESKEPVNVTSSASKNLLDLIKGGNTKSPSKDLLDLIKGPASSLSGESASKELLGLIKGGSSAGSNDTEQTATPKPKKIIKILKRNEEFPIPTATAAAVPSSSNGSHTDSSIPDQSVVSSSNKTDKTSEVYNIADDSEEEEEYDEDYDENYDEDYAYEEEEDKEVSEQKEKPSKELLDLIRKTKERSQNEEFEKFEDDTDEEFEEFEEFEEANDYDEDDYEEDEEAYDETYDDGVTYDQVYDASNDHATEPFEKELANEEDLQVYGHEQETEDIKHELFKNGAESFSDAVTDPVINHEDVNSQITEEPAKKPKKILLKRNQDLSELLNPPVQQQTEVKPSASSDDDQFEDAHEVTVDERVNSNISEPGNARNALLDLLHNSTTAPSSNKNDLHNIERNLDEIESSFEINQQQQQQHLHQATNSASASLMSLLHSSKPSTPNPNPKVIDSTKSPVLSSPASTIGSANNSTANATTASNVLLGLLHKESTPQPQPTSSLSPQPDSTRSSNPLLDLLHRKSTPTPPSSSPQPEAATPKESAKSMSQSLLGLLKKPTTPAPAPAPTASPNPQEPQPSTGLSASSAGSELLGLLHKKSSPSPAPSPVTNKEQQGTNGGTRATDLLDLLHRK